MLEHVPQDAGGVANALLLLVLLSLLAAQQCQSLGAMAFSFQEQQPHGLRDTHLCVVCSDEEEGDEKRKDAESQIVGD